MTKQEQIEFIRQKCVEANPSIMDLVFGCRLKAKTENSEYLLTYIGENNNQHALRVIGTGDLIFVKEIGKGTEIIGRDIRLADVLITLRKVHMERVHPVGYNWFTIEMLHFCCNEWNLLKDNLNDQSDECVEFIYNLLK